MKSTLTAKGQTTIPKAVREHLKLKAGDQMKYFFDAHGHVTILPAIPVSALSGIIRSRLKLVPTIEEMDEGIAAGIAERYKRSGRS